MGDFPGARSSRSSRSSIRRSRRSGIRDGGQGRADSFRLFSDGEIVDVAGGDQEAVDPEGVPPDTPPDNVE